MKPGFKTTEWWMSMAVVIVGILITSGLFAEASALYKGLAFLGSTLAALGYTSARAVTKKAEALSEVVLSAEGLKKKKPPPS